MVYRRTFITIGPNVLEPRLKIIGAFQKKKKFWPVIQTYMFTQVFEIV